MCTIGQKPWALAYMLGALVCEVVVLSSITELTNSQQTMFDLFIIVVTVVNALDRPHQKQADVITALQRDGALMFVVSCL
jgi:hypothetical protein